MSIRLNSLSTGFLLLSACSQIPLDPTPEASPHIETSGYTNPNAIEVKNCKFKWRKMDAEENVFECEKL